MFPNQMPTESPSINQKEPREMSNDPHANEYLAAVRGMQSIYGRRGEPAVGDSIWVKLPNAPNQHAQVVVVAVDEAGRMLVKQDGIADATPFFVSHDAALPF